MRKHLAIVITLSLLCTPLLADPPTPKSAAFVAADIHTSPPRRYPDYNGGLYGDRYIAHQATMLDLISAAYGAEHDNVQGGPAWLERDRFDIIALAPTAKTPKPQLQLMLQALLAERFHLVTHPDTKPMPAYVLSLGDSKADKPKLKESDGTGDGTCQDRTPRTDPNPNLVVACTNMTMDAFADALHQMAGGYLDKPVVNETGLKGVYDFEVKWTGRNQLAKAGPDGISIFNAVDKELGLKLELKTAPRPVIAVDSVDQHPTPNVPDIAKIIPPPPPAQFDVATIKPAKPDERGYGRIEGTQIDLRNIPVKDLLAYAWDLNDNDPESIVAPKWIDTTKIDILAKVDPASLGAPGPFGPQIDDEELREMVRAFVTERYNIKAHMEDRPVTAYTLTAPNPKLKKADPNSRTRCAEGPGPDGKDPRITTPILNRLVSCQNMTMAQIGEELQRIANGYIYNPVLNATNIPGSFDFTLSFTSIGQLLPKSSNTDTTSGNADGTSEPNGALSLFDAVNKQLGLKLEKGKRPLPVLVIEHIDETPTAN
jgi:uncharacterized protein (TIGR03435 family)